MDWLAQMGRRVTRFLSDDRGTAGLEFVTTSPLIFGVLVFTAEYGQALRARMTLDSAVQDTARYLARAPLDNTSTVPGQIEADFYPATLTEAQGILQNRMNGMPYGFSASIATVDENQFRTPFYRITVEVRTAVDLPLLSIFNLFREDPNDGNLIMTPGEHGVTGPTDLRLFMQSDQLLRWVGGSQPGAADCTLADQYQGLCP